MDTLRKRIEAANELNGEDTPKKSSKKTPKKSPLLDAYNMIHEIAEKHENDEEEVPDPHVKRVKTPVNLRALIHRNEEEDTEDSIIDSIEDNKEEEKEEGSGLFDI